MTSPLRDEAKNLPGLARLLQIVRRLRAKDGCPWDKQQTMASMGPHLVEEAFEAADALRRGDAEGAREELGDVLVNVALLGQISQDGGGFDTDSAAAAAADKLVRRHPHVFGDVAVDSAEMAYRNWERIKQDERAGKAVPRGALAGVPLALPALLRAFRIGEKATRAGFDWPDRDGPRSKITEELAELDEAVASGDQQAITGELGDLLFSICNFARHLGCNPEVALAGTTDKFQRRFDAVEQEFAFDLRGRSLEELDAAWNRAKRAEQGPGA